MKIVLILLFTITTIFANSGDVSIDFVSLANTYKKTTLNGEKSIIENQNFEIMGMNIDTNLNLIGNKNVNIYLNLNFITFNGNLSDSKIYVENNITKKSPPSYTLSNNLSSSLGFELKNKKVNLYLEGGFGYQNTYNSYIHIYEEEYTFLYTKVKLGGNYYISDMIGIGLYFQMDNIFNADLEENYNGIKTTTSLENTFRPKIGVPIIMRFNDDFDFHVNVEYQNMNFKPEEYNNSNKNSIKNSSYDTFITSLGFSYYF